MITVALIYNTLILFFSSIYGVLEHLDIFFLIYSVPANTAVFISLTSTQKVISS